MAEVIVSVIHLKDEDVQSKPTPIVDIDEALKYCKFGYFHMKVLCASFFGFLTSVAVSNTIPYILPNAECDLHMHLLQKGVLNAMLFIGMIISSVISGFLTDTFGRKPFLTYGYAVLALLNIGSAISQTYLMIATFKFMEGFVFAVAFSPTMTYMSECCYSGIRDRLMLLQSSFLTTGAIIIALMSWAILTYDLRITIFNGSMVFNTWNMYLLIMILPPIMACIMYCLLPESPKYLLSQQRYSEARAILVNIYKINSGKPEDTFPYANIWEDKVIECVSTERKNLSFLDQLKTGFFNAKPIFRKPLVSNIFLICILTFLVMFLYNTIRLWFPQLSTIVEHYQSGDGDQDLCVMLDAYTSHVRVTAANASFSNVCVPHSSGSQTYINSIIMSLICFLPYIINGIIVNRVEKKIILFISGLLTIGITLGLRWTNSKAQVVGLFSMDTAISQSMMSLLQTITVEVFPTTTRTLAMSMVMTCGRTGTLVGNIVFPILLNMGCVVPFYTLAGLMANASSHSKLTPMADLDAALKYCKLGYFHLRVLSASFCGYLTSVAVSNSIPYILPVAECDLHMDLIQKGVLNATLFSGMIASSIISGFLTDTFGRKPFLTYGYAVLALLNIGSASSQNYLMIVIFKFMEGFVFAIAFNPTMTYISECCYSGIRDRLMLFQSTFLTTGAVILALMSWAILPLKMQITIFNGAIVFNTWNMYLLIITLAPIMACIMYCLLPESPKYLLSQQRYSEARAILVNIYKINSGKPEDTFPSAKIWEDKVVEHNSIERKEITFLDQLKSGFRNSKPLFRKPLLPNVILICIIIYFVMFLFNTFRLWFPQLSTIVEHYKSKDDGQDLCVMLDAYTAHVRVTAANSSSAYTCVPQVSSGEAYINSIIMSLICFLPYIINGIIVNKVEKKRILFVSGLLTIGITLGLRWTNTKPQVMGLFSIDTAISQCMLSLLQTIAVEVFPTTTRTLAIAIIMTCGRMGTLSGNIVFPILLNMGCVVPFYTLAGLMACVTAMTCFLPKSKKIHS